MDGSRVNAAAVKAVWLTYSRDLLVEYAFGAENDPANPFGRVILTVLGNGDAAVNQYRHGSHRQFSGRAVRQTIDWILELLNAASFPLVADHAIPPGATRSVRVVLGGRSLQTQEIAYHVPPTMPAYQLLFKLLDELITTASDHALPIVAAPRAGLLAD